MFSRLFSLSCFFCVTVHATSITAEGPNFSSEVVWVFFRDKPSGNKRITWSEPRSLRSIPELGLSIDPSYLHAVESRGVAVRFCSRWFNAVSASATPAQRAMLADLPFVRKTLPVRHLRKSSRQDYPSRASQVPKVANTDYGPGFEQLANTGVIALHNEGFTGKGVRIAILDAGFPFRAHKAFQHLEVIAERDFVAVTNNSVQDAESDVEEFGRIPKGRIHGTQVLSVLAANDPGGMIGVAPDAEYLLATTEDLERELPIEEDLWIAGLEWADSLGAQVVNSSVGYNEFDDGSGYTYNDMDGQSALTTVAAEMAVARGMVIVVGVGNEAALPWHYVVAPADGANVIAVGAVGLTEPKIASFSSRGPTADGRVKPDVVAPGLSVVAVDTTGVSSSSYAYSGYRRVSGTSFAAPLVSGIAALIKQINPTWTPIEIADVLRTTARDLGESGPDTTYGWGLVNALTASGLDVQRPQYSEAHAPFPNPLCLGKPGETAAYFPLQLADNDEIEITIYTVAGLAVDRFVREMEAGDYTRRERVLRWQVPAHLAGGIYLYTVRGRGVTRRGKIALIR